MQTDPNLVIHSAKRNLVNHVDFKCDKVVVLLVSTMTVSVAALVHDQNKFKRFICAENERAESKFSIYGMHGFLFLASKE